MNYVLRKRKFGLFGVLVVLTSVGCSSIKPNTGSTEKFAFQREWAISTLSQDFFGGRVAHRASPVVEGDIIYQSNAVDGIAAVDARSGQLLWKRKIEYGSESTPVISGNIILFGANDGQFYALEKDSGLVKWSFPTRTEALGAPTVQGNLVLFLAGNNVLYALDIQTGQQKWTFQRRELSNITVRGGSKPAVYKDRVIVGFSDGVLVSVRLSDGTLNWERALNLKKRFKDIDSPVVIDGSRGYAAGFDDQLYCFNADSGDLLWSIEAGGVHAVTIGESALFYATTDGRIISINKSTGKALWEHTLENGIATQPFLYKDLLVMGESEKGLIALLADNGKLVARYDTGRGIVADPFLDAKAGKVLALTQEGNLFRFQMSWLSRSERLPWD